MEGRVLFAPNDDALTADPTWVRLDDNPSLVASWQARRGRDYELDTTDGGDATVVINDRDGILDPTNTSGPYYTAIEPLVQVLLQRYNPVLDEWQQRFRGFISDWDYSFDPSQQVNQLTLSLVDIFEILNAIEMQTGAFGDVPPPAGSEGQVYFAEADAGTRVTQILTDAAIPAGFYVVFTLNVGVYAAVYSPGETSLTALQETVDAEFPGVSNAYPDRFGRLAVHGRLAKFDPATIAAGAGDAAWDWKHWHVGDGAAVQSSPSTRAQLRAFAFNRGLGKIINSALATPVGIADADVAGQLVQDLTSIGARGYRSWTRQNLQTRVGLLDSSDALTETKRFAQFYVDNYAEPRNRVTVCTLRSIDPAATGAGQTWKMLCQADISDQLDVTVGSPGGGGFNEEPFFIEGITEESRPLNDEYDDVTMSFDLSPQAYFTTNPFPTS